MAEAKNFLYAFCGKRKVKPTYNNTDAADGRFQSQVSYPDQIFATSCVKFSLILLALINSRVLSSILINSELLQIIMATIIACGNTAAMQKLALQFVIIY